MSIQKNFKLTDDMFKKYNELKSKLQIASVIDFFMKMLNSLENNNEECKELQQQNQRLLIEIGRLQALLQVQQQQQQQTLPKQNMFQKLLSIVKK
jgi:hypothetical protein